MYFLSGFVGLALGSRERRFKLYNSEVLFKNDSLIGFDCFIDSRVQCQTACRDQCWPLMSQPEEPLSVGETCLLRLPHGCKVGLKNSHTIGTSGCRKSAFVVMNTNLTLSWEVVMPIKLDFWELIDRIDDVYLLGRSAFLYPWRCPNSELSVQVNNSQKFSKNSAQIMEKCGTVLVGESNRYMSSTVENVGYFEGTPLFGYNITLGYLKAMRNDIGGTITPGRHYVGVRGGIHIYEENKANVEQPPKRMTCTHLVTSNSGQAYMEQQYEYFGLKFHWTRIRQAEDGRFGIPRALIDTRCQGVKSCNECKSRDPCSWCMTPIGRMCSSDCKRPSEVARPIDKCSAAPLFITAPLIFFPLSF